MRSWLLGLLSFLGGVLLLIAWCNRPLDPNAWRSFARTAQGDELEQLASGGYDREQDDRWNQYLAALRAGDDEAFAVARRLCPLIVNSAHPSEEFVGALGWSLERRPAEVFELVKPCFQGTIVCQQFDEHTELEALRASVARRRTAVTALLDGGLSAEATACVNELRD
ncbi:MAG: hypothetical protein Q8L48_38810 [Archangium sp.]|nr:hypothetical protein [Archangium sp.]